MPYFLAQPRPARVSPFGRYSQPIHPQGANVTEKGYAFFARVTLHY